MPLDALPLVRAAFCPFGNKQAPHEERLFSRRLPHLLTASTTCTDFCLPEMKKYCFFYLHCFVVEKRLMPGSEAVITGCVFFLKALTIYALFLSNLHFDYKLAA